MLSEGMGIAEVCRRLEIVEATFHRWPNEYGGMKADSGALGATQELPRV